MIIFLFFNDLLIFKIILPFSNESSLQISFQSHKKVHSLQLSLPDLKLYEHFNFIKSNTTNSNTCNKCSNKFNNCLCDKLHITSEDKKFISQAQTHNGDSNKVKFEIFESENEILIPKFYAELDLSLLPTNTITKINLPLLEFEKIVLEQAQAVIECYFLMTEVGGRREVGNEFFEIDFPRKVRYLQIF